MLGGPPGARAPAGPWKTEGLGEGGGGSRWAVTSAAIVVNYGRVESRQVEREEGGDDVPVASVALKFF